MADRKSKSDITIREKIVIRLVIFLIQMIHPYEYEHMFKQYFSEMKELIGIKTKFED